MVDLQQVVSSNVEAIGYDKDVSELYVKYRTGKVYTYLQVPEGVFEKLKVAESKGGFVNAEVKKKFDFQEVQEPRKRKKAPVAATLGLTGAGITALLSVKRRLALF